MQARLANLEAQGQVKAGAARAHTNCGITMSRTQSDSRQGMSTDNRAVTRIVKKQ